MLATVLQDKKGEIENLGELWNCLRQIYSVVKNNGFLLVLFFL